jgi:hypothetical protein
VRRAGLGLLVLLGLLTPEVGVAQLRRIEAVGVVAAGADAPRGLPIREAAVEAALREAVVRVAADLADGPPLAGAEDLAELFGQKPSNYVARYRLIEDRGTRRPLLVEDPAVTSEYVVVVVAHVDSERVRRRLVEEGFLAESILGRAQGRVVLVLEGLRSYRLLAALRERLGEDPAVGRTVPEAFDRDGAALAVYTSRSTAQILDRLLAEPPHGVEIVPLREEGDRVWIRLVERRDPSGSSPPGGGAAASLP